MDGTRVCTPSRAGTDTRAATSRTEHLGVDRQVWQFARHYLEMCAAMCIGGVILNTLVFVVGRTPLGYPDLRQYYPGLALVVPAVLFTLPMAAWMRIRGMAWRPTMEMSGAPVGLAMVTPSTRRDTGRFPGRQPAVARRSRPPGRWVDRGAAEGGRGR